MFERLLNPYIFCFSFFFYNHAYMDAVCRCVTALISVSSSKYKSVNVVMHIFRTISWLCIVSLLQQNYQFTFKGLGKGEH